MLFKKRLLFITAPLCESGFSQYSANKIKYRSKLSIKTDISLQLSFFIPNLKISRYICTAESTVLFLPAQHPSVLLPVAAPLFPSETPPAFTLSPWRPWAYAGPTMATQ